MSKKRSDIAKFGSPNTRFQCPPSPSLPLALGWKAKYSLSQPPLQLGLVK